MSGTDSGLLLQSERSGSAKPRVGIPIHERQLTEAFLQNLPSVVRPGAGRSIYVLEEVDLGAGRPDVVVLTISSAAFESFRRTGLRLPSPLAARALDLGIGSGDLGASVSHVNSIRRELRQAGWFDVDLDRIVASVHDSLAVEAKMKDWKQAVRQVGRFRSHFRRSAVLMPKRPITDDMLRSIGFYGFGLLFRDGDQMYWEQAATEQGPPGTSSVWLLELLLRGLEGRTAYRAVAS